MRIAFLLLVVSWLGGCANGGVAASASLKGSYNCYRVGHSGPATAVSRVVTLHATSDGRRLALGFGKGSDEQVLDPLTGTAGAGSAARLYANQRYAWRLGAGSGVMTDVESITTYSCVHAGTLTPGGPQPATVSDAGRDSLTPAGAAVLVAQAGSRSARAATAS